ncbi:hypothetical protein SPRG_17963, partial [Saprolegnia parasitica CBS 223.65]
SLRLTELRTAQALAHDAARRKNDRTSTYRSSSAHYVSSTLNILAATVTNVPCYATAADVAAFCRQHANLGSSFLSVSMAPYEPGRRARSTVYVASTLHLARLLSLDGLDWQRAPLCVREVEPNTVTFTCSSTDATAFAITFDGENDYRYRVCFKVTSIVHCCVGINRFEHVVVRFTLQTPPFLFVGDPDWDRSDDPSPNGAFGHCRCYHLVLADGVEATDVIFLLTRFGVTDVAREPTVPVYAGLLSPRPTDWAYGHAYELQHLSFPLRYALHVLISQEALVFERGADAATVVWMLAQTHASATDVIEYLYTPLRSPPDMPPNLHPFGRWLSTCPNHPSNDTTTTPTTPTTTTVSRKADDMTPATMPQVRRVLVTPLRIVVEAPEVVVSNRVLRQYAQHMDRFLRVSFVDEHFGPLHGAKSPRILDRIAAILRHGLVVGGETYVFLGYSSSQLRAHSCWFYRDPPIGTVGVPTAASIYASVGQLDVIPSASTRGARLGQALSTTTPTVRLRRYECGRRPDSTRNGYVFSDGIGAISPYIAQDIADDLGLKHVPSAFQIRYGSSKGVVSVNTSFVLTDINMELRDSMHKFASEHDAIEVCSVPQVLPAYLNRQLITLLSTLGVRDDAILSLADDMLRETAAPLDTLTKAIRFVKAYAPKAPIRRLLEAGISIHDQLVADWLHLLRRHLLYSVQFKARIRVPDGVVLMGVLDETGRLPEGCVFFQSSGMSRYAITPPALGTRCVVGRNPSLHPGDLRILTYYADVPALHHLYDVLVFSSRGDRPVTDMMSGGDLDGDLYFCLWDHRLVPAQDVPPMHPPPTSWGIPPPSSAPGIQ